ncbi:MAG: ATP-binding cassette domain-containing protein [Methylotenera sp.]|nr:ATP-binding cassette domain-containing protein [Oligoflexia bacterium]
MIDAKSSLLRLQAIRKTVGPFSIAADFEIRSGERIALVGPSGCGKTSLLRIISGLDAAEGGEIRLNSRDITHLPAERRRIGYVFQESALFPSLNLIENVTFALRIQKVPRAEREALALPWLQKTGLADRSHASVQNLSGGERQRVAFIRAILSKPELLLLDEPFSALDSALRSKMREQLVELHQLWPVPLLFVTHDEMDVASVATDRLKYDSQTQMRDATSSAVRKFYR